MKKLPKTGEKCSNKITYTEEKVQSFAKLCGDNNPIHLDSDYAAKTIFKKPIVHGMFVASQISNLIANQLPGPGSIYLSQTVTFTSPVYHNDTIQCVVEVVEVKKEKSIVKLKTDCINQDNIMVINGNAVVKLL